MKSCPPSISRLCTLHHFMNWRHLMNSGWEWDHKGGKYHVTSRMHLFLRRMSHISSLHILLHRVTIRLPEKQGSKIPSASLIRCKYKCLWDRFVIDYVALMADKKKFFYSSLCHVALYIRPWTMSSSLRLLYLELWAEINLDMLLLRLRLPDKTLPLRCFRKISLFVALQSFKLWPLFRSLNPIHSR